MLKKLQNLLFEEEDTDEEEDDEEEEVRPAKRRKKESESTERTPSPSRQQAPVFTQPSAEAKQPSLTRIDVTQPLPKVNNNAPKAAPSYTSAPENASVFRQSQPVQHASPRPVTLDIPNPTRPVEKPKPFGISADEAPAETKKVQPAAAAKPVSRQTAKKKTPTYEFKPVISPMFGVDDKDMDAMQTTAKAASFQDEDDKNVTPIISPIYGVSKEAEPTTIQTTVEKSNKMEHLSNNTDAKKAEDEIPEFSLDDILNARDEEFARETAAKASKDDDNRQKDIDETVVLDSSHLQPFGKVSSNPSHGEKK